MPYRIDPHTADVRIFVFGDEIEELFRAALPGICETLSPSVKEYRSEKEFQFEVSSYDQTALLIDFLNEALFLMHDNKMLIHNVVIDELEEDHISGKLAGFHVEEFEEDIKAVTYHEAEIIKNENGQYETNIILDL